MRYLLEVLTWTVVLATPYLLFDYGWATTSNVGIVAAYCLLNAMILDRQDTGIPNLPLKDLLILTGFQMSVPVMAIGVVAVAITAWAEWVWVDFLTEEGSRVLWSVSIALVVAPALFLALPRVIQQNNDAEDLLTAVREKGIAPFRECWLRETALSAAIFCLLGLYVPLRVSDALMTALNTGETLRGWELAIAFPSLSLGILLSAALLALTRLLMKEGVSGRALVRAYVEGAGNPKALSTGKSILGSVSVLWGFCIVLFLVLYPLHLSWRLLLS